MNEDPKNNPTNVEQDLPFDSVLVSTDFYLVDKSGHQQKFPSLSSALHFKRDFLSALVGSENLPEFKLFLVRSYEIQNLVDNE